MIVNISKGQKISCGENVSRASVSLSWNNSRRGTANDLELDLSAFILYADGKVKSDDDFIFYNNPSSKDGAVEMTSDDVGNAEIKIDFDKIQRDVSRIAVTLTIYGANERQQTFKELSSAIAEFSADEKHIATYSIDKSGFNVETAIVICEVYRYKGQWRFAAIGAGYRNGLKALCAEYGIQTLEQERTPEAAPHRKPGAVIPKPATKAELISIADALLDLWATANAVLRQNNITSINLLYDDLEIADSTVYASIAYLIDRIRIERGLKSDLVKRLYSKSWQYTGTESIDKEHLRDLLNNVFDKLNFVEVQVGSRKTDATCLYCTIICAIGILLLKAASELNESDAAIYEGLLDVLGSFDKTSALEVLSARGDTTPIKELYEWHEKYISSGVLFDGGDSSLEELLEELDTLTGLQEVKNDVNSLINMVKVQQMRKERNLAVTPMSLHLVFYGNPGTGKTTVARLIAKIYKAMGLLKKGHLIEVDRSKLVAGYVGQTAIKVSEAIESAIGGVLFIDEAYTLTLNKSANDFGQEAVDTLLKAMEDRRGDFIVIVAGYDAEMQQFILSNPGLQSCFNKYIYFEDYTPYELLSIFKGMCAKSGLVLAEDAETYAAACFNQLYKNPSRNYANARDVRNFYEKMLVLQANRLAEQGQPTNEDLSYIKYEDVAAVQL